MDFIPDWLKQIFNHPTIVFILSVISLYISYRFGERKSKNDRQIQHDEELVQKLSSIMKKNNFIAALDECGIAAGESYLSYYHSILREYYDFCKDPNNVFISKKLEAHKKQLLKSTTELNRYLTEHNSISDSSSEWNVVISSQGLHADIMKGFPPNEDEQISKELDRMIESVLKDYANLIYASKKL